MSSRPAICFVGYANLPILTRGFENYQTGGEEVQQTLLAKALAKRGYRVSMVVGDLGQRDGQQWHGVTTFKSHRPSAGLAVLRFLHPRWTGLHSALKRANADVYYVSPAGAQLGQVAMFAGMYGRRVIFRIAHDANCDPRTLMIRFWRDRRLYEYGLRRSNAILAQTVVQQQLIKRYYDLDSTLASMMVEPATHNLGYEGRDVDVLWVNNLRRFKRPDLFVELARAMPSTRMHMVGGPAAGFDDVYLALREQVPSLPHLTYHGPVPYHDVNDLYERSRVFVNTSDTEGFPNSYLQAWVRGVPVVAFFDPDGVIAREGLGNAVRTLPEMQQAVHRLLTDSDHWADVSVRCRRYMQKHYNEERILEPYIQAMTGTT